MSIRAALVTGAGQGIGRAIALRLAKDGYNVAVNDIGPKRKLADLRREIESLGRSSIECMADVSKEAEVKEMVNQTTAKLGSLDVMVANAGIALIKPFTQTTTEDWDKIINTNAKGIYMCYRYAADVMIKQGNGGRIIGASSVAGKQGLSLLSLYSASKFAVRSLTQTAAIELKPHGITVNAYAPGFIQTQMGDEYEEDMKKWGQTAAGTHAPGQPEDIAALVSFLVSKEAHYITGQSVSINGGLFFD